MDALRNELLYSVGRQRSPKHATIRKTGMDWIGFNFILFRTFDIDKA